MAKIFINVCPRRIKEDINVELLLTSLKTSDVAVPEGYSWEYEYDCRVLQQAVNLSNYLYFHGVEIPIGLTCDPTDMYSGWILILDTRNHRGSLNAVVSQFFSWSGIENQYIMEFEELVKGCWDGNF